MVTGEWTASGVYTGRSVLGFTWHRISRTMLSRSALTAYSMQPHSQMCSCIPFAHLKNEEGSSDDFWAKFSFVRSNLTQNTLRLRCSFARKMFLAILELTAFEAMHTSLKIRRVCDTYLCLVHDISWYIRHELARIANLGSCL